MNTEEKKILTQNQLRLLYLEEARLEQILVREKTAQGKKMLLVTSVIGSGIGVLYCVVKKLYNKFVSSSQTCSVLLLILSAAHIALWITLTNHLQTQSFVLDEAVNAKKNAMFIANELKDGFVNKSSVPGFSSGEVDVEGDLKRLSDRLKEQEKYAADVQTQYLAVSNVFVWSAGIALLSFVSAAYDFNFSIQKLDDLEWKLNDVWDVVYRRVPHPQTRY